MWIRPGGSAARTWGDVRQVYEGKRQDIRTGLSSVRSLVRIASQMAPPKNEARILLTFMRD